MRHRKTRKLVQGSRLPSDRGLGRSQTLPEGKAHVGLRAQITSGLLEGVCPPGGVVGVERGLMKSNRLAAVDVMVSVDTPRVTLPGIRSAPKDRRPRVA